MLQTLIHIPHALGPLPIFGWGWAFIVAALLSGLWLALLLRDASTRKELPAALVYVAVMLVVIVFVLPIIEDRSEDNIPLGIAIRGYGVMMLLAIVAGVGLAVQRARRLALDPEIIFSLAMWMCGFGIVGARLFYVVQKWDEQFARDTTRETIVALLNFFSGGLVVFGAAIGALVGLAVFCRWRKLPTLAIADLVAPSMLLGLAIGRVGCLLNGCCYGGYCAAEDLPYVQFPQTSPVYADQLDSGMLFGFRLEARGLRAPGKENLVVAWIEPGSAAEQQGLQVGDVVTGLQGLQIDTMAEAIDVFRQMPRILRQDAERGRATSFIVTTTQTRAVTWTVPGPITRSLPVHPTQIYSAIDALLLFLVLWFFYPFRQHDGEVTALMLTLHPISRFVLEVIRVDEQGALGTPFTISQLVGFLLMALAVALWIIAYRSPRGSALPLKTAAK